MKLDLNKPITGLDGKVIDAGNRDLTYARQLAPIIFGATKGDSIKLCAWAIALHNTGVVEVDKSDAQTLKEFVASNERLTVAVKAPILEAINFLLT